MDSTTIRHLQESIAMLPVGDLDAIVKFYRRLFELAPEAQSLFKRDMELQTKKFSETIAWVIAHLEQPNEMCERLRELGARHGDYGVKVDQYAPVGSALIWMFQHTLGDRFTSQMEEAWLEFYAFASLEMERGSRGTAPMAKSGKAP